MIGRQKKVLVLICQNIGKIKIFFYKIPDSKNFIGQLSKFRCYKICNDDELCKESTSEGRRAPCNKKNLYTDFVRMWNIWSVEI